MQAKLTQRVPLLIAIAVIGLVCLARWRQPPVIEQFESRTYDWRARFALAHPAAAATNLGFVAITDDSITRLKDGSLGFHYGLYWPRHIYGRALRELAAQGASAAGFDILFGELRPDHAPVLVSTNGEPGLGGFLAALHPQEKPALFGGALNVESDEFFAWQLQRSGIAILAAQKSLPPQPLFRASAPLGDISAEKDTDGVLRRARAFQTYRLWHPLFEKAAAEYGVDLKTAKIEPQQITLTTPDQQQVKIPLASDGTFSPADLGGAAARKIPRAKPFADERVWHMGIMLAARGLGLDLEHALVDLPGGKIILRGAGGVGRTIPVDAKGYFYVNWELPAGDARVTAAPLEKLVAQDIARERGETNGLVDEWRGKLVAIGSTATGNDLTDLGATPLGHETFLVSKHWNVANSVLTGRFIRRTGGAADCGIIAALGALTAWLTWRLRALSGLLAVVALALGYVLVAVMIYNHQRLWLPVVLPIGGAMVMQNICLMTWRVVFEQAEKRRVRSVFSKIVAPEVVHELLGQESLSLGGARREVTVFFADVRGFTTFTDENRAAAAEFVRANNLAGAAAEKVFDEQAREALHTVNSYLALIADTIKLHGGTLDKYIGDCVMAFWGAPVPRARHALDCVLAAVDAQRAIDGLNRERADENSRRDLENIQRAAAGQPTLPRLPILSLGTGINTGPAVVGLMGSDKHGLNYTVFGREVNLASRLESLSGRGRIFIGETTFAAIQRDDAALAASCTLLAPTAVKGFREAVKIYEVPWRRPGDISPIGDDYGAAPGENTSTGLFRRA